MSLEEYENLKLTLASLLRNQSISTSKFDQARNEIRNKLANDRFNLVTVGRFSRGKSSLMNALIDTDQLPTGIIPLTSVITIVHYGSKPTATLHYYNSSLFMDVPISDLPNFITAKGNPGNRQNISRAEISLPSTLLKYGFRFVDTPGLGSASSSNTETTLLFLKEADSILLVTSFDSPLALEEIEIIRDASHRQIPVFLAINKLDLIGQTDHQTALAYVDQTLMEHGFKDVTVFSVSALPCSSGNANGFDSGIKKLREALINFFLHRRQEIFLNNIVRQFFGLFTESGDADGNRVLTEIATKLNRIEHYAPEKHLSVELRSNCSICVALGKASFDQICSLQYRVSQDSLLRSEMAHRALLCPPHLRQYQSLSGNLSVAQGLADVVEALSDRLTISGHDPVKGTCPVCETLRVSLESAVNRQAEIEPDSTSAICLRHMPLLFSTLPVEKRDAVHQRLTHLIKHVSQDMKRFALRREARMRSNTSVHEDGAVSCAINIMASSPDAWGNDINAFANATDQSE